MEKSRICIFNDYNIMVVNLKKQVRFTKRLESTLHCEFTKRADMHKDMHEF